MNKLLEEREENGFKPTRELDRTPIVKEGQELGQELSRGAEETVASTSMDRTPSDGIDGAVSLPVMPARPSSALD